MGNKIDKEGPIIYVINEDKRTVTGYYGYFEVPKDYVHEFIDNMPPSDACVLLDVLEHKKFPEYKTHFFAKAICKDGDKFDVNIGKKIVKHKIDMKRHIQAYNQMTQLENILCDLQEKVSDKKFNHLRKANKIEYDYIKLYLGV